MSADPAAPMPRLCLLGPPVWRDAGGEQPVPAERRHQLLAMLAWTGQWHPREQLAALFWPRHPPEAARRNLRKVLHRAAALPGLPALELGQGALRWTVATDLQQFEAALARQDLDAAAQLWRGEPLAQLDSGDCPGFGEWLLFERRQLQDRWRDALVQAADQALARRDAKAAAWRARQALALDALDEPALCRLLQALLQAGDAAGARQMLERFAARLRDTLGLTPAASTLALLADGAAGAGAATAATAAANAASNWAGTTAAAATASASAAATPSTPSTPSEGSGTSTSPATPEPLLPPAPAGFIGRQAELAELQALLGRPEARWITVIGPGGIGKTHLLRQAASQPQAAQPDGTVWVALDDLHETEPAVGRVCSALGRHLGLAGPGVPALALLAERLASRRLLLLLDNLEQLPEAAARLHALGDAVPGLRIVASSRRRLGLPQEWLLPLAGLPCPAPEDAERADAFDAVRLFVQQARQHQPHFDLAREREGVVRLCQHTDGLPLALALAAVWTRHYSAATIADELARSLELLRDPDGRLPQRHHSLDDTLQQTWQRLQPAEREALLALAVCRGGCEREAAQAVAGAGLALLAALVDTSMLRSEPGRRGPRFALHPLVQQWLLAQHARWPEAAQRSRDAHTTYFLGVLARYPATRPAEQPAYLARWQDDEANLADAWRHAAANPGQAQALADGAVGLMRLHEHQGRWHEGLALLAAAEPVLAQGVASRGVLRFCQGTLSFRASLYPQAEALAREAQRLLRHGGRPGLRMGTVNLLGLALWQQGRLAPAARCFEQALQQARALADPRGEAAYLTNAALVAKARGRYDEALALLERSIAVARPHVAERDLVTHYNNLGNLYRTQGRPEQAISTLQAGLAALGPTQRGRFRSYLLANLALAQFDAGRPEAAEALCAQAHEAIREGGEPSLAASVDALLARILGARGDWQQASRLLASATRDSLSRGQRHLLLDAAVHWAELLQHQGRQAQAAQVLALCLADADTPAPTRDMARQLVAQTDGRAAAAGGHSALQLDAVVAEILAAAGQPPAGSPPA